MNVGAAPRGLPRVLGCRDVNMSMSMYIRDDSEVVVLFHRRTHSGGRVGRFRSDSLLHAARGLESCKSSEQRAAGSVRLPAGSDAAPPHTCPRRCATQSAACARPLVRGKNRKSAGPERACGTALNPLHPLHPVRKRL